MLSRGALEKTSTMNDKSRLEGPFSASQRWFVARRHYTAVSYETFSELKETDQRYVIAFNCCEVSCDENLILERESKFVHRNHLNVVVVHPCWSATRDLKAWMGNIDSKDLPQDLSLAGDVGWLALVDLITLSAKHKRVTVISKADLLARYLPTTMFQWVGI